ncbi:anti-anti-sigma regulatory factor (antagonist of anti-sigma factor) [Mycolicibacterium chubuense NBB4]|uniref:Anti-anti-sigma regulatory factor (Antagonist of anti-sigma factor) n=1 Tax=Mycolicibacterium chubuense (strain NBB4) TaxID=710421 RepID=I4BRJ4_MYCCN|nr:STAS domain-containing protein [Mycolicibacterium chubuense]AFM19901.1 anti-anti-sigma regulatory factor (antagonist of anti-sigma factor) [Mycolicibacterium chubuense NBB4]
MRTASVNIKWTYPPPVVSSDEQERCGNATFAVRRCSPTRTAVAVVGEIDAINGRGLGRYVERHTRASRQLVLDLRAVDFFGSQGFTALYFISVQCARSDVDWVIVGGPPVQRLLAICDPEGELPFAPDLGSALSRLDRLAQCGLHVVWSGRCGWRTR